MLKFFENIEIDVSGDTVYLATDSSSVINNVITDLVSYKLFK